MTASAGLAAGSGGGSISAASAGISLYKSAQELEQLSRTEQDRKKNSKEIREITSKLSDRTFVAGYGSIGGEEFFSYLNISDSLRRAGGPGMGEVEYRHEGEGSQNAKQ